MIALQIEWQEQCGLGQTGTIRQGLRLIHTRITNAASSCKYCFITTRNDLCALASPPASPRHINGDGKPEDVPPSFFISKNSDDVILLNFN